MGIELVLISVLYVFFTLSLLATGLTLPGNLKGVTYLIRRNFQKYVWLKHSKGYLF